jgi:hypothetical protein
MALPFFAVTIGISLFGQNLSISILVENLKLQKTSEIQTLSAKIRNGNW